MRVVMQRQDNIKEIIQNPINYINKVEFITIGTGEEILIDNNRLIKF